MSLHFLTEEWVVSIGCLLGIFYGISKVDRLDPESPASKTVDGSEIPNNLPPGVMLKPRTVHGINYLFTGAGFQPSTVVFGVPF